MNADETRQWQIEKAEFAVRYLERLGCGLRNHVHFGQGYVYHGNVLHITRCQPHHGKTHSLLLPVRFTNDHAKAASLPSVVLAATERLLCEDMSIGLLWKTWREMFTSGELRGLVNGLGRIDMKWAVVSVGRICVEVFSPAVEEMASRPPMWLTPEMRQ